MAEPFKKRDRGDASAVLLHLDAWEEKFEGLTAGFTTRQGGFSAAPRDSLNTALHVGDDLGDVVRNRRHTAEMLGWDFAAWTCAEQVHSARVRVVTAADRGSGRESRETAIQDTDALITNEPDLLLVMYFADCVPLYFLDPETGALGLAHAGWKGTVADIAGETVRAMTASFGTKPENLLAAIGPSIGSCCYEVDEPVMKHVRPLVQELQDTLGIRVESRENPPFIERGEGHASLDLKEINRELMIKAGILPSRIEMTSWCTGCRTDLFFSHRKENGATGRMMSWLGKKRG